MLPVIGEIRPRVMNEAWPGRNSSVTSIYFTIHEIQAGGILYTEIQWCSHSVLGWFFFSRMISLYAWEIIINPTSSVTDATGIFVDCLGSSFNKCRLHQDKNDTFDWDDQASRIFRFKTDLS